MLTMSDKNSLQRPRISLGDLDFFREAASITRALWISAKTGCCARCMTYHRTTTEGCGCYQPTFISKALVGYYEALYEEKLALAELAIVQWIAQIEE